MIQLTYFLKVILCSSIFFCYYWIALRNKKFHQYNRFYLLIAPIASWFIPLIKFRRNGQNRWYFLDVSSKWTK
jgi:ABC-type multidrug transport system permease subunit